MLMRRLLMRRFLKGRIQDRIRKFILADLSLPLVVALSLVFGLIINVASVLVRPLWFG
jgi:hypothetical protein